MNRLYQGDNLTILKSLPDASVDLTATDPPFFTQKESVGVHSVIVDRRINQYLKFMEQRAVEMHRVLKDTSLYLHCDPTASHYLKVMLRVACLGLIILGMKSFGVIRFSLQPRLCETFHVSMQIFGYTKSGYVDMEIEVYTLAKTQTRHCEGFRCIKGP